MFISQVFMTYFFRLVNFGIIISLGLYLFKKNALPLLYNLMAKKEEEKNFLLSSQLSLEVVQEELKKSIQIDNSLCENFKVKINEWNQALHKERVMQESNVLVMIHAIKEKQIRKNDLRKKINIQETISEKVVNQLYDSLTNYFHDESRNSEYLNSLITSIDEKTL